MPAQREGEKMSYLLVRILSVNQNVFGIQMIDHATFDYLFSSSVI